MLVRESRQGFLHRVVLRLLDDGTVGLDEETLVERSWRTQRYNRTCRGLNVLIVI
jgi:hypothetical protein